MRVYHSVANEKNIPKIIFLEGLKINSAETGYTSDAKWALGWYDYNWPIFVTFKPGIYEGKILAIDLPEDKFILYPDLPGLVDTGAYVNENGTLYWETDEEAGELAEYLDEGEISIDELMEEPEIREAALKLTGSAAILRDIPPQYISLYN